MNLTQSIKRPSLHEELVERLRNLVVEDELKPGEKVPEKELCEAFGVSRTPLREALKVLASEGLVVLQANRGSRVAEVTQQELESTFPVIAVLEQLAGELACQNITEDEFLRLEEMHEELVKSFSERDRASYFQINQDIHQALISSARNPVLASQHQALDVRVRRARFKANLSETRWAQAIEEHNAMMQMLRLRDGECLGQIMKTHMLNKLAANIKILEAENIALKN